MNVTANMPETAAARGKIAPIKFAHIVLRTSHQKRLVDYYQTLLEAKALYQDKNIAFLTYDDEHHRLAIAQMPGLKKVSRRSQGMDHFAFTYASLGDLLATYERLKAEGITPVWTTNHGPTFSFYYKDPDGNIAELQVDIFEDVFELENYLNGKNFSTNPIGEDFDPDEIVARFKNGERGDTLFKRGPDKPRDMTTIPLGFLGPFHWIMLRVAGFFKKPH
ncbi:MAG: VOC family protein [Parvibaculaceae bacterium]|nr:VOC family protein [Parvibaculaceae bacterium]